jgi:hypothetical protein
MNDVRWTVLVASLLAPCMVGLPASAQAQSVADIFLKLDLIGTWSVDCARPASRENPHYVVERPQFAGPVQRQTVIGQTSTASTIDVAYELPSNELLVSLVEGGDQSRRVKSVWRIERNRVRVLLFVPNDGRASIAGGKLVSSGAETPWINRCGS